MARDNNTGKTKEFYDKGQAIFGRIPGTAGVDILLDECRRIISAYRETNDAIVALWRQAHLEFNPEKKP